MMKQDIESFLNKMESDPEFGAKVWAASEVAELLMLAREEGFLFDEDDLFRAAAWSDDELDAVSGGSSSNQSGLSDRLHELVAEEHKFALRQRKPELRRKVAELLARLGKS